MLFLLAPAAAPGWPPGHAPKIGLIDLACTVLHIFPQTAGLGAVRMLALLGGAMATHIRAEMPLWSNTLFSLSRGLFMRGGLWLPPSDPRALFAIKR